MESMERWRSSCAYRSGAYRSGAYRSGAYRSGAYRSGAYRSGAYRSGAYRSGYPSGSIRSIRARVSSSIARSGGPHRLGAIESVSTMQVGRSPAPAMETAAHNRLRCRAATAAAV